MADNTTLNLGTGGDVMRTQDKPSLSAKVPHSLIDVGGSADSESIIGDSGIFMPVEGAAAHDAAAAGNPIMVGAQFDDAAPDSVDEGDVGWLRISANRNLYATLRDAAGNERGANVDASNRLEVTDSPGTTGGCDTFNSIDLDETHETVKASAGQVYAIHVVNQATARRYLHFYDNASPTVGTTAVKATYVIPTQGTTDGAGFNIPFDKGQNFGTAITVAATTDISGNAAPDANDVVVTILYK